MINVYWNEYGLIQTDATNDIVVYSFLAWLLNRVYNDTFRTFTFSMQQSVSFVNMTKNNQDNSFNFRFQIGNYRQSKRLLANLGIIHLFHYYYFFFIYKNRNMGFSPRHLLQLQKFCMNSRFRTGSFQWYRFDFAFILVI